MPVWAAQSFRIAWFGSGLESAGADQIFSKGFAIEPENIHRNRVPNQANPFWSKASGTLEGGGKSAEVQVQPGRLDVVLMPVNEDPAPTLPLDTLDVFLEPLATAMSAIGPAFRLAVIVEVVELVGSSEEASLIAQGLANIAKPTESITDFSYQLNNRRQFRSVKDQTMNRLVRWATSTFQIVRFSVGPEAATTPVTDLSHAASVFMDLNNVPSPRPLEPFEQLAIYKELVGEFRRLAEDPTLERLLVSDA